MFVFKILAVCIIMVAILLIAVILIQEPKDRIMSPAAGTELHRVGLNQKANFLEKTTWVLTSLLLGLTLLSAISLKYATKVRLPLNITRKKAIEPERNNTDTTKPKEAESENQ
ncbi:preprotein translocase subunit SecG [Candidatus Cardinium hertigii]|uniref:Protein-export membrane protein SecG n=1 Tax=Candidatus Cardinium hertigii TaxID=247481 RepID=A0A2Z3LJR3_9BACT|nr:preprotein translocase subunit SecG [Candidatus Cardinium hertigii]AWN82290.1 hypothetical protein DK880_00993 [Candidatus Cardinium hertigii]